MNKSNRPLIITVVIIAVIVCVCVGFIGITGMGYSLWNFLTPVKQVIGTQEVNKTLEGVVEPTITPNQPETSPLKTPTQAALTTNLPSPTQQAAEQTPSASLPVEVSNQMDQIEQQVIEIRGLNSNGPVTRQLLSREQLRQHVVNDFLKDYSEKEASDDAIFLSALGLLKPDFDLYNFYIDLYTEQIAGYYDDKTDEMFVVQGSGFNGPEKLTYAHEFVHALQDIHYGTDTGLGCDDAAWETESERCAAYQALVEGDASFMELLWFSEYGTAKDLKEIQDFYNSYQSPVFDSAPAFMREDFMFPYTYGQPFVEYLHNQSGWQSVDQAYSNPPVSTEQILHPEKYPNDKPVQVDIPDLSPILGEGWREIDRGEMGEWSTYLILALGLNPQAQINTAEAQEATAGWGGDAYVVYYNEQEHSTVLVLSSTWDTEQDAEEFSKSFAEYADARFGPSTQESNGITSWKSASDFTTFSQDGKKTLWITAPSEEIEMAVRNAINSQ